MSNNGNNNGTGLSQEEIRRYARHLTLSEVGVEGQKKLKSARILSIGAGGLGSPIGIYLAAAGVGHIGVVDFDEVDESNLQRQIAHTTQDVGRPKVESIKAHIEALNPHVAVETHPVRLDRDNAIELFKQYDLVIDGSDNFATRYLVNDAAYFAGIPLVYGSIFRFEGQLSVFDPHRDGPCYRCLYPSPPPPNLVPNCAEAGVLGVLPGTVGLIMATEAIKLVLGVGETLTGRLMLYNSLKMNFKEVRIRRNPNCELCGETPTITELVDYEWFCGLQAPAGAADAATADNVMEIRGPELKQILEEGRPVKLLDVREPHEWEIVHLQNAELTPLSKLDEHIASLDPEAEIYLYCYKGTRSMKALKKLQEHGFKHLRSLAGGIDAWAQDVDPSLPRY